MKRRTFIQGIGAAAAALPVTGCSVLARRNRYSRYTPKGEMPRRTLGRTGMDVSMLGFGSHLKKELIADPELRDRMIKLGYEGGINLYDVYDHGGYEQFKPMGKSLSGFRRGVLVSLCAVKKTEELQGEIDGALKDFHTDYIDLYRLYTVDDDRMNIMEKNRQAGKIRAIGVVTHDAPKMMEYIDRYDGTLDYVMIVYNFHHNKGNPTTKTYPYNDYSALIPRCERLGLGILGIKPMGSDAMIELAKKERFFEDREANIAQSMLRHVYATTEIDCTMPAMNSMEEVITNLESAYDPSLSPHERTMLEKLSGIADQLKAAYLPRHYRWLEKWAVMTV